jgi:Leucine rich repeat variant
MAYTREDDPKLRLAKDYNVDPVALASLAAEKKASAVLLCAIACNPATPEATLRKLANHPRAAIRRWVAQNPRLSAELIEHLSTDEDEGVTRRISQRRDT